MSWIYLTIGSIFFFTGVNITQRVVATDSDDPRASSAIFNGIAATTALILLILTGSIREVALPSDKYAWLGLGLAVVFYGLFERGRLYAAKKLDASVLTVIQTISVVVAFVGSSLIYGESITLSKIIGGLLIVCALIVVSYSKTKSSQPTSGIILAVALSVILGLGWMLDKSGATHFNASTYNFFVWSVPLIIIVFPTISIRNLVVAFKKNSRNLALMAVLNVTGYFMQLKALETADATTVIPIVQTSIILTVILGIFLLKERSNIYTKIFAGILAFVGSYIMLS